MTKVFSNVYLYKVKVEVKQTKHFVCVEKLYLDLKFKRQNATWQEQIKPRLDCTTCLTTYTVNPLSTRLPLSTEPPLNRTPSLNQTPSTPDGFHWRTLFQREAKPKSSYMCLFSIVIYNKTYTVKPLSTRLPLNQTPS